MADDFSFTHPELADIESAALLHATYFNLLTQRHGVPQQYAADMTAVFVELSYKDDEDA